MSLAHGRNTRGMNGRRRPTIEDVAAEAGVSRGTVSRVLNGGHYVSPGTLDAVNRAIKKTGYVVNQHARSLVTQRSESVAFILSEPAERLFADPNFAVLLRGCTQALAEHDIGLFVCIAASRSERARITRFLAAGHVDGALLVSAHAGDPLLDLLGSAGVPVRRLRRAARLRVEGLLRGGRRAGRRAHHGRVPAVGRADADRHHHRAARHLRRARTAGGVPGRARRGRSTSPWSRRATTRRTPASGAMTRLLERRPDLDAVFVASDVMAVGALNALRRAGRRVPEDVAIGGFDDSSAAVAARPALTTMRQPWQRISSEMVRLLLAAIAGGEPSAVILPTELVRRESA